MLATLAAVYVVLGLAFLVLLHERLGRGRGGTANPIEQALGIVTMVLLWPLILAVTWRDLRDPPERRQGPPIPVEWLYEPVTLEEAEAVAGKSRAWDGFVSRIRPGDELWRYRTPEQQRPSGRVVVRTGIALVRGGEPVAAIQTMMYLLSGESSPHSS